jgi:hypothetical protein
VTESAAPQPGLAQQVNRREARHVELDFRAALESGEADNGKSRFETAPTNLFCNAPAVCDHAYIN